MLALLLMSIRPLRMSCKCRLLVRESPEIEKFLDKVSFLVEEALQSNELINVFQDDFEMLAEDDGGSGGSKISSNLRDIRNMSDLHHSAKKKVTCIRFHPS